MVEAKLALGGVLSDGKLSGVILNISLKKLANPEKNTPGKTSLNWTQDFDRVTKS